MENFPEQAASIATANLTKRWLLVPLLLLTLGGIAFAGDLQIAQYFEKNRLPGDLQRFIMLCETFGYGLTAFVILLLVRVLDPRRAVVWKYAALATFAAGIAANLGKICFCRVRPHALVEHLKHDLATLTSIRDTFLGCFQPGLDSTLQSFPSGHAATAAGLAVALTWLYPHGRWAFLGLAILACFQRLASQSHYLSDVLCGAALGSAAAIGFLLWAQARIASAGVPAMARNSLTNAPRAAVVKST